MIEQFKAIKSQHFDFKHFMDSIKRKTEREETPNNDNAINIKQDRRKDHFAFYIIECKTDVKVGSETPSPTPMSNQAKTDNYVLKKVQLLCK